MPCKTCTQRLVPVSPQVPRLEAARPHGRGVTDKPRGSPWWDSTQHGEAGLPRGAPEEPARHVTTWRGSSLFHLRWGHLLTPSVSPAPVLGTMHPSEFRDLL